MTKTPDALAPSRLDEFGWFTPARWVGGPSDFPVTDVARPEPVLAPPYAGETTPIETDWGTPPEPTARERYLARQAEREARRNSVGFDWGVDEDAPREREWRVVDLAIFLGLLLTLVGQLAVVYADRAHAAQALVGIICLYAVSIAAFQAWYRHDIGAQFKALLIDLNLIQHPED